MNSIIIDGVSHSYGQVKALRNISIEVRGGELFGLIGPDGAGKTTLFRILTTLILPDSGTALINGLDSRRDYREIRKSVGYMPGRFSLYQDLSVAENLDFFATLFNTTIEANYHLVRDIYVQLEPFKTRLAGALSGGMKQKLALCCSLIHKPEVLLLDEPTTGVDPVSRSEFWNMLKKLKEQGITILVSTPYMDEANLCDRIALITNGTILTTDTPAGIISSFAGTLWAVRSNSMHRLLADLRSHQDVSGCFAFGSDHHVTIKSGQLTAAALKTYLAARGHESIEVAAVQPGIEDCFMSLL